MRILEAEFRDRVRRISARMQAADLDALIAYASPVQYGMVRYMTGYEPWLSPEEWAFSVLAPGHGAEISLLSNSPWDFWEFNRADATWISDVVVGSAWVESIAQRLPARARRVGIAGWSGFPAPIMHGLRERFPNTSFHDASAVLRAARTIKSEAEIEVMRQVGELCDLAGQAMFEAVVPGATEREVVARIDSAMMLGGSEQFGYSTIFGSGPRTIASCFQPSNRVLRAGDAVQLDCAPMLDGYKADFSRVTVVGDARPAGVMRLLETAVEMYERCVEMLRPGITSTEMVHAALIAVERNGYTRDNLFASANYPGMVFMAHGLGLENPDPPGMISTTNDVVLEEGMVINLEPILLDPGVGGARVESSFVVRATGPEQLDACAIRPWAR
jgi:Xaa-Pro aminopeptidase